MGAVPCLVERREYQKGVIMATSHSTVVGVFEARLSANRAVEELRHAGFREDQIDLTQVTPDRAEAHGQGGSGKGPSAGFRNRAAAFFKALFASGKGTGAAGSQSGRTVVTVRAPSGDGEVWSIFRRHGAYNRANPPADAGETDHLPGGGPRCRTHGVEVSDGAAAGEEQAGGQRGGREGA
jgi:hypothetical protein